MIMVSDGYAVQTDLLTNLGKDLDQFAQDMGSTLNAYPVSGAPDFGQDSGFPAAFDLKGHYESRAKDHADSRAAFLQWVQTMSNVASILGKRYATIEDLGKAKAEDIKSALDLATTRSVPGVPTTI